MSLLYFVFVAYGLVSICNAEMVSSCLLPVRKICTDPNGNSTLGSFNLTLNLSEGYGGDNWVSSGVSATSIKFRLTPPDYNTTWHSCPVAQFIMNMNAAHQVTFSNGDSVVFEAGEIFYCNDTLSSGHISQAYKNQSRYSVFVEVDSSFDDGPCPNPDEAIHTKKMSNVNDIPLCSDTTAAGMQVLTEFAKKT